MKPLPCPFCGEDNIEFREQKMWTGMENYVVAVTISHWCLPVGHRTPHISFTGKTYKEAAEIWNRRA